ncbi:ubiquitin carboxyl-terminal hydrolase 2 [Microdochium nivale]|nr:ubiquitin carboxyl-terminal hydrolase 2 [Microdochium nivale]
MSPIAFSRPTPASGIGSLDMASGANGLARAGAPNGGKAPFKHIDDLVNADIDIDPHSTLRRVLQAGDTHMRQAVTYSDFNRPDLALQEYIRATTIAVITIPQHKDYPALKADRGDLGRLYQALKSKINAGLTKFEQIKEMIKEDNRRSGVQPTKQQTGTPKGPFDNLPNVPTSNPAKAGPAVRNSQGNGSQPTHSRSQSVQSYGSGSRPLNSTTSPQKAKPTIQPKPQSLHGNTLKQSSMFTPSEDLSSRFAKLQNPSGSRNPVPLGEWNFPPVGSPNGTFAGSSIDGTVPKMPKAPDAIYSPARGTVSSEVANLPSSTARGMFSRTNSIASAPSESARTSMERAIKTFSKDQTSSNTNSETELVPQPTGATIPTGDTISTKDLLNYMRKGSSQISLLLIDVRSRGQFDDGHIMSQRTICVDPEILMREGISADDIADSMVLAPPKEKTHFENRHNVDLVVMYDQETEEVPRQISSTIEDNVLFNLVQALTNYNFSKPLLNPPKLLVGGINGWTDVLGAQSLAISKTSFGERPTQTPQLIKNLTVPTPRFRSESKTQTVDLSQKEIEKWNERVHRSTDDFLRRFPSIENQQESMMARRRKTEHLSSATENRPQLYTGISPSPPARPAPALPRTRYSGLESKEDSTSPGSQQQYSAGSRNSAKTGLVNLGNTCFANSTIQALLAAPRFVVELTQPEWPLNYKPSYYSPDKHPQLMSRIMGNMFQWLRKREFPDMQPHTFLNYINSIHAGYTIQERNGRERFTKFGDGSQHDVTELITFLSDQLDLETQRNRSTADRPPVLPAIKDPSNPMRDLANDWMRYYKTESGSIIDKYWRYLNTQQLTCRRCGVRNYTVDLKEDLWITPQERRNGKCDTLEAALRREFVNELLESECDACKAKDKELTPRIGRLPPLLRVGFRRFDGATFQKNTHPIQFPFRDLDLSNFCHSESERSQLRGYPQLTETGGGFSEPCHYDLFAVLSHAGSDATAGHYVCRVKDGASDTWWYCNDRSTSAEDFGPLIESRRSSPTGAGANKRRRNDTIERIWNCEGGFTPYMLFYKRRDIPWET